MHQVAFHKSRKARSLVVHDEEIHIGWPGFIGSMTAVAKGRFSIAINQPPLPTTLMGKSIYDYIPIMGIATDWLAERPARWKSDGLPPAHLLRKVMDEATDYQ